MTSIFIFWTSFSKQYVLRFECNIQTWEFVLKRTLIFYRNIIYFVVIICTELVNMSIMKVWSIGRIRFKILKDIFCIKFQYPVSGCFARTWNMAPMRSLRYPSICMYIGLTDEQLSQWTIGTLFTMQIRIIKAIGHISLIYQADYPIFILHFYSKFFMVLRIHIASFLQTFRKFQFQMQNWMRMVLPYEETCV